MDYATTNILRLPAVKKRTGLSRSSIYLKMHKEGFPKTISLGDRSIGWIEDEINQWIEKRVQISRGSENDGLEEK